MSTMTPTLKIQNEEQYLAVIEVIDQLWDSREGTQEHRRLEALIDLVHDYENVAGDEVIDLT